MPIDLVALLGAVSGLSGLVTAAENLIGGIRGKKREDEDRRAQTIENIKQMTKRLEEISELGWSLNDYRGLLDTTVRLRTLGDTLFFNLGNIPDQSSLDATKFISVSTERAYGDLRSEFTTKLLNFLTRAKYLDERDQGVVDVSINVLTRSFGGADTLLQQTQLDYATFRTHIRDIVHASEDLVGIADNKISLITDTLIKLKK